MFSSTGLFTGVPCPQGADCQLINCIFDHNVSKVNISNDVNLTQSVSELSKSFDAQWEPSRKKRRVEEATTLIEQPERSESKSPGEFVYRSKHFASNVANGTPARAASVSATPQASSSNNEGQIRSTMRDVSPPPLRKHSESTSRAISTAPSVKDTQSSASGARAEATGSSALKRITKNETLTPRKVPQAPAKFTIRVALLEKLHTAMVSLNARMAKDKNNSEKALILSSDELITMALNEEEKAAKENQTIYSNVLKQRIVSLNKMTVEQWKTTVLDEFIQRYLSPEPEKKQAKVISNGLTATEEIALLEKLVTPLKGLEKHGYVTSAPTKKEIEMATKGIEAADGWEKCDRCSTRFQVFPGRREDGTLTSHGRCRYHWARPYKPPKEKGGVAKEPYYPCCQEAVGISVGCTTAEHHVFKVSDPKRLASILQFEETPSRPDDGPKPPLTFDCEMGYTTLGLELVRLTAVSWPHGKEVLDILVRPMGEILDLNSRFSGVWPEDFTKAVPYGSKVPEPKNSASEAGEVEELPLQVVESPAAARTLLFKHLQPDTPVIGHAIDNDLNVCRIIHHTIVDTVLLYPHPRGLPIRFGLKMLSSKHLERNIQTGGAQGHDSKEDAIATGDLVRVKIGIKWEELKIKGWKLKDGGFLPPEPLHRATPKGSKGTKRKNAQVDGAADSTDDDITG